MAMEVNIMKLEYFYMKDILKKVKEMEKEEKIMTMEILNMMENL